LVGSKLLALVKFGWQKTSGCGKVWLAANFWLRSSLVGRKLLAAVKFGWQQTSGYGQVWLAENVWLR